MMASQSEAEAVIYKRGEWGRSPNQKILKLRLRDKFGVLSILGSFHAVRFSPEVLAYFRATGAGWQTRMDEALREYVSQDKAA